MENFFEKSRDIKSKNIKELSFSKLPDEVTLYKICKFLNDKELRSFQISGKHYYNNEQLKHFLLRSAISNEINNLFKKIKIKGQRGEKTRKLIFDELIFNKKIVKSINICFADKDTLNAEDIENLFTYKDKQRSLQIKILSIENKALKYFPLFKIFPNVKEIKIEKTDLEELVINGNFPNLKKLKCEDNEKLKELIIVKGHEKLEKIFCRGNSLINLSIINCKNLKELFCNNNNLKNIDGKGCVNLSRIFCSHNFLKEKRIVNIPNNCNISGFMSQKTERGCLEEDYCPLI